MQPSHSDRYDRVGDRAALADRRAGDRPVRWGWWMQEIPKQPVGPRVDAFNLHKSVGLTILALMVVRVLWRSGTGRRRCRRCPRGRGGPRTARRTSRSTCCGASSPLSGYLGSVFSGYPVKFFGMTLPRGDGKNVWLKDFFSGVPSGDKLRDVGALVGCTSPARSSTPSSIATGSWRGWASGGGVARVRCRRLPLRGAASMIPGLLPAAVNRNAVSFSEGSSMTAASAIGLTVTVNGKSVTADVDPRTLLVRFPARAAGPDRHHVGCDTGQCGACTVQVDGRARQVVHRARGAGMTALSRHHRGPRAADGDAAPDAGGLHGMPRPAVRLLHAGHGDERHRLRAAPARSPTEDDDPRGARRQSVPLHRLSQHRQGGAARRRGDDAPATGENAPVTHPGAIRAGQGA